MNFGGTYSWELTWVAILAFLIVLQFAWEGLVLTTGVIVVKIFSAGHIRIGDRRILGKALPKINSGQVFYYEGGVCYIYQNFAQLIGLVFWLATLLMLARIGLLHQG